MTQLPAYTSTNPAFYLNEARRARRTYQHEMQMALNAILPLVVIEQAVQQKMQARLFVEKARALRTWKYAPVPHRTSPVLGLRARQRYGKPVVNNILRLSAGWITVER